MKILAIDQARRGGWSVFDAQAKTLESYDTWEFPNGQYVFPKAVHAMGSVSTSFFQFSR